MYSNDSYIMERGYEQAYERSETISQPKDCPECTNGRVYYSKCCGADVFEGICQDPTCGASCVEESEKCDKCEEGLIYE